MGEEEGVGEGGGVVDVEGREVEAEEGGVWREEETETEERDKMKSL